MRECENPTAKRVFKETWNHFIKLYRDYGYTPKRVTLGEISGVALSKRGVVLFGVIQLANAQKARSYESYRNREIDAAEFLHQCVLCRLIREAAIQHKWRVNNEQ